jgi:PmbA protein
LEAEDLAKRLLGMIERSGVDEGEVYVERKEGLEISLRDQAVDRLRIKDEGGYALRLISDKRMAFVHSSDLRPESLERSVELGVQLAGTAARDESNALPEPSTNEVGVETYDQSIEEIQYDRKLALLKDVETLAFAYDPSISKVEYLSFSDSRTETVVANTKGVFQRGEATLFSVDLSVVAERDGEVETGAEESQSRFFSSLSTPSEIVSRACWKALSLLGGKTPETQSLPVIFDRNVGRALLGHLFAMVRGDNVADGLSMLAGRIGAKIASDRLTIVDDPTVGGVVGSRGFDAEGVCSGRTVVIDGGVLRSFLFDTRSALKAGGETTANARRENLRSRPAVGYSNFFVERGAATPEDIIRSTDEGLWVISLAGWWVGVNPSTGDFSSGAKGLWVEGGEAAYPVRNVTIASNVLDMLGGVDAVGNDLTMEHASSCPTFRIGEMKVGGV